MADHAHADMSTPQQDEEKEKRWKKQLHRMGKILAKAWDFDQAEPFQEILPPCTTTAVLDLVAIGEKIDKKEYRVGKHGWEDFAKDLGGVYNRHMARKTKHAARAKEHLQKIKSILGEKDRSLSDLASEHVPHEPASTKKRKAPPTNNDNHDHPNKNNNSKNGIQSNGTPGKKAKLLSPGAADNGDLTIGEREDQALEALKVFVEQKGGSRDQVESFRCRVTKKKSEGRYDINYYNEEGRRFRSMVEVGRYLNLVKDAPVHHQAGGGPTKRKGRKVSSREQEAERKRLRKETDRLKREHQKAKKALDEFCSEEKDTRYPIDDILLLQEEEEQQANNNNNPKHLAITPMTCAAARVPDLDGFPGVPRYCIPDVIMAWDFLCTFGRVLSLNPIPLDDFAAALTYQPPESRVEEDVMVAPPVYLAEAHLGLLKLLLHDTSSDEWWWSILETDEADNRNGEAGEAANNDDKNMPVIKIDMAALLLEEEDPLITASWLGALEDVRNLKATDASAIKQAILSALPVVANKWVKAYLRKALRRLKASRAVFTKRAVVWLVDHVREARPDLWSRNVKQETINQQRAKIVDDTALLMEKLESSAPAVTEDDLVSDADSEDYGDSDDSDDEDELITEKPASAPSPASRNFQDLPASAVPQKPPPSIVDILLPPHKPSTGDLINPFTWSQLAGATACRIFHRYKRLRNEVDDKLRDLRELAHLTVHQRRQREALAAIRVFSECVAKESERNPLEKAMEHLSAGGAYLSLSTVERLCILRALIDAAYDTGRVYEVVDGNFKQRMNAVKALEAEKRRAKREEKDEAAAAEAAGRQQLAVEARAKFFEEKRIEIKETNDQTREFDDDFIDNMTDDDIVEFDEDIKAEYHSLPGPESFNKTEVNKMIVKIQECAAFGTTALTVVTMEELSLRERTDLETMEAHLDSMGGSEALMNPTLDRESSRMIERLLRDIERAQKLQETLPAVREAAIESLRDAVHDGTLKALKAAVKQATTAKLCGEDHGVGGMWAVDILRDAKVEIKNAEKRKRLLEAQRDLIAKRDKCFIRSEPQGQDRFRNRFWRFENDDRGHCLWVEADYLLKDSSTSALPKRDGFINLLASEADISVGAEDLEEDLTRDDENPDLFRAFCRREYHPTGRVKALAKRHWGCQVTEKSLLAVIKKLDERGVRENELKTNLKEALEDIGVASTDYAAGQLDDESENNGKQEDLTPATPQLILSPPDSVADPGAPLDIASSGDEDAFQAAKVIVKTAAREGILLEVIDGFSTAIGQRVRVREVLKESKESAVCRYDNGTVNGWTFRIEQVADDHDEDEMPLYKNASVPYWRAATDRGRELWLSGVDVMESISRFFNWSKQDKSYFEYDASFLTYRNSLGRHCGRASDAAVSSSPAFLAQIMVKREVELYTPLKNRVYDNNWGGKSGARNIWISQMKDFAYDLSSVRQGLLTLENAFFELTGQLAGIDAPVEPNGKALLHDTAKRFDIELETLEKSPQGIWSSHESRAVFQEIVQSCTTTGVLALALDLLCRNCRAYLDANKMFDVRGSAGAAMSTRTTRRMNAWQQANNQNW